MVRQPVEGISCPPINSLINIACVAGHPGIDTRYIAICHVLLHYISLAFCTKGAAVKCGRRVVAVVIVTYIWGLAYAQKLALDRL